MRLLQCVHQASWVIQICLIPFIMQLRILVAFTPLTWIIDEAASTRVLRLLGCTNLLDSLYCLDKNPCKSGFSATFSYKENARSILPFFVFFIQISSTSSILFGSSFLPDPFCSCDLDDSISCHKLIVFLVSMPYENSLNTNRIS